MTVVSFWLELDEASQSILDSLVSNAHALVGGPRVVPHITIRGSIDMEPSEASALLHQVAFDPIDVTLTEVRLGTIWNMALYAVADSGRLADLRAQVDKSFDLAAEAYGPHVSFAYGLSEVEARQTAGASIAKHLPLQVRFDAISAWITDGSDENDVDDWIRIERVAL